MFNPNRLPRILRSCHATISLLALMSEFVWSPFAQAPQFTIGVDVNSFQNFDAAEQDAIVQQLVSSSVREYFFKLSSTSWMPAGWF